MNSTAQKVFKILIVEDNDELRTLIAKDILNDYETLEATNGRDGLKMAILHNPDMILSDVQMPEMNGFELCKELKNDIQCSHIPVILLTAKVLNENKLEGYQSGADDYIEKPFSGDLLQLKINNMLETRQQWQMHFGTKPTQLPTANTTFSDTDNAFLKQSNELIEQHIAEIQFDVEDFCKEMGLSQGLIYRKIKALTGLSISEYIRLERLNKAASLIKENKYTVQEICFMVGFATPSYFTKCFKKQFGTLPKEFKFEN
jgi:DNA-binding response OmpR family regulator